MEEERSNVHVLVIPLPFHGHINPMLQFAKRVASKGPRVTLLVPEPPARTEPGPVNFEPISLGPRVETTLQSTLEWFRDAVPRRLPEIAAAEEAEGRRVGCVVYDSGAPWILGLAHALGVAGGSFFTHSCAVACVYCHVSSGLLKIPLEEEGRFSLPGLPVLGSDDLPSFISEPESYPSLLELVISRFSNIGEADWIFFSSFEALEKEVILISFSLVRDTEA